jgi:hypothetical protein
VTQTGLAQAETDLPLAELSVQPVAELTDALRRNLIAEIKAALALLQKAGFFPSNLAYKDITQDRQALGAFIDAFRTHQPLFAALMRDQDGKQVTDRHTKLAQGVTLAQIEQLLVRTCAKRYFMRRRPRARATERRATIKSLMSDIIKRSKHLPLPREAATLPIQHRELMPYLAFRWQLDLLPHYATLPLDVIRELGDALLALETKRQLTRAAGLTPSYIAVAKGRLGDAFASILRRSVDAIEAIGRSNSARYHLLAIRLGKKLEAYFARDAAFLAACEQQSDDVLTIFGGLLVDIELHNFTLLTTLPAAKLTAVIEGLRKSFGDHLGDVLAHIEAGPIFLGHLVEMVDKLDCDDETLLSFVDSACHQIFREFKERTKAHRA